MRALCALGGAARAASARVAALRAPGRAPPLHLLVDGKARVRELRALAAAHYRRLGMTDLHLFGIALLCDGEYLFVDVDSKLSKYAPKSWRSSHTHGLDANGRPLLELHLVVQFYVDSPLLLHDDLSRHHYFNQLRANLVSRDALPTEVVLLLAGLALQAEYGDASQYEERDYFNTKEFAPPTLTGDWVATAMRACHRENSGLSKTVAETRFIREVCLLSEPVNCHRYRLRASKNDPDPGNVWLTINSKGIRTVPEDGPPVTFVWSSIGKLSFDRKKFEIRSEGQKITLYSSNDLKNKYLLSLCRETHQFSMMIASQFSDILKKEEEERKCNEYSSELNLPYSKNKSDQRVSVISSTSSNTTSGIVSDRVHSEDELEIMIDSPPAPSTESLAFAHLLDCSNNYFLRQLSQDGRFSKTSSLQCHRSKTARNSSSGESKDAVYFADGSSSERSSSVTSPSSSNVEQNNSSSNNGKEDKSESPTLSKLKCNGSQCSSSCSTVVMSRAGLSTMRRPSSVSSLELGYSHTAQNSMVSDNGATSLCHDGETASALYYDGIGQPATIAASSETSGVYTMGSSEMTGQNSDIAETERVCGRTDTISHFSGFPLSLKEGGANLLKYGSVTSITESVRVEVPSRTKSGDIKYLVDLQSDFSSVDCIDGVKIFLDCEDEDKDTLFRQRADSSISATSFHGDGSDPTNNKNNLLSALELSELIVGRGVYPKRQSVSDTLDSVSDYVRLPLTLEGESYIQGHEDTAPSEENFLPMDDAFLQRPPTPPKRLDSWKGHSLSSSNLLNLERDFEQSIDLQPTSFSKGIMKPPPPYDFKHNTVPVATHLPEVNLKLGIPVREPPPYPGTSAPRVSNDRDEISARLITTKPVINILKAETEMGATPVEGSFARPVSAINLDARIPKFNIQPKPDRHSVTLHNSSYSAVQNQNSMHRASESNLLIPMMKPSRLIPPPPTLPRHPPPPPPPTFCSPHLAHTQIEQFQQQLYSDVDYVIYPLQDPAISQQNYLDSKHTNSSSVVNTAYHKNSLLYRSTPFLSIPYPTTAIFGSTQNLSDTYVQLPTTRSSIYTSPSQSSSVSRLSLHCDQPPVPRRPKMPLPFARTKSDENILNSCSKTTGKFRRLPPPPPPYEHKKKLPTYLRNLDASFAEPVVPSVSQTSISSQPTKAKAEAGGPIDIKTLREKSRNLDLPLIAALCNDRSLLKQTKAFGTPKPSSVNQNQDAMKTSNTSLDKSINNLEEKTKLNPSSKHASSISSAGRKMVSNHRNPNDKLPAIPGTEVHTPRALYNTYVAHPGAVKNKKLQSS